MALPTDPPTTPTGGPTFGSAAERNTAVGPRLAMGATGAAGGLTAYQRWLLNNGGGLGNEGVAVPPPDNTDAYSSYLNWYANYRAANGLPSANPDDATAGKTFFGIHASPTGVLGAGAGLILGGPVGAAAGYSIGANSGGDAGSVDVNGVTHPVTESNPFKNTTPAGAGGPPGAGGAPVDFNNPGLYGYGNFSPGAQQQTNFYNQLAAYQASAQAPILQRTAIDWSGYGSGQGAPVRYDPRAAMQGVNIAQGPAPAIAGLGTPPVQYNPQAVMQGVDIAQGPALKGFGK